MGRAKCRSLTSRLARAWCRWRYLDYWGFFSVSFGFSQIWYHYISLLSYIWRSWEMCTFMKQCAKPRMKSWRYSASNSERRREATTAVHGVFVRKPIYSMRCFSNVPLCDSIGIGARWGLCGVRAESDLGGGCLAHMVLAGWEYVNSKSNENDLE